MVNETKAYETRVRTKCPFYGFAYAMEMLIDSKGNQCALVTNSHSPCRMEMSNQEICWNKCRLNKEGSSLPVEKLLESAVIFPNELMPKGASSWEGIPLKKWYEHIINGRVI